VCTAGATTLDCATAICAMAPPNARIGTLPTGCALRYDDSRCTGEQICLSSGMCGRVACTAAIGGCDDGNACNGTETCNVLTRACIQVPPVGLLCPSMGMCVSVCTPTGCVVPQLAVCGVAI